MHKDKKLLINLITTESEFAKLIQDAIKHSQTHSPQPTSTPEKEELLTTKNLSIFFQVSETTIHAWKNKGLLPYIRINSRIRFKKSEVLKLHEKRRNRTRHF